MTARWLTIALCCCSGVVLAQRADSTADSAAPRRVEAVTALSIVLGDHFWKYNFYELGVGLVRSIRGNSESAALGVSVSSEFRFADQLIMAPKISAWIAGGLDIGVNLIYYRQNGASALCFRPEIGAGGFSNFKLVYGYNFALTNPGFTGINTHTITFEYMFDAIGLTKKDLN